MLAQAAPADGWTEALTALSANAPMVVFLVLIFTLRPILTQLAEAKIEELNSRTQRNREALQRGIERELAAMERAIEEAKNNPWQP